MFITKGYNPEAPALTSVGGSNPIVASSLTVPTMDFSVPPPPIPTGFAHQHGTQIPAIVYNAGMLPPYNHPQPGSVSTSGIVTVGGTTLAGGISQGKNKFHSQINPLVVFYYIALLTEWYLLIVNILGTYSVFGSRYLHRPPPPSNFVKTSDSRQYGIFRM